MTILLSLGSVGLMKLEIVAFVISLSIPIPILILIPVPRSNAEVYKWLFFYFKKFVPGQF